MDNFIKTIGTNPYIQGPTNALLDNPVSKFMLGTAKNVAQDMGVGMGYNAAPGLAGSQKTSLDLANRAAQKAQVEQDPIEKARLLKVAQAGYATNEQASRQQAQSYSPDVKMNPALRAPLAALQIVGTADVAAHPLSTIKGIAQTALHPIQSAKAGLQAVSDFADNPVQFVKDLPWNPEESFRLQDNPNALTKLGNRVLAAQYPGANLVTRNPSQTIGQLADYGLTTPDEVNNAAQVVTGTDGEVNKAVVDAVKSAGTINTGDVLDANGAIQRPGLLDTAKQALDDTDFLSPIQKNNLTQKIVNTIEKGTIGAGMDGGDPEQMLSSMRAWEAKAQPALDIHGNIKPNLTPEEKELAGFYQTMAKDLYQRIFVDTGIADLPMSDFLTSGAHAKIAAVSPKLADDILNGTIGDGRHIQSMFVGGSKMVNMANGAAGAAINPAQAITGAAGIATGNPVLIGSTLAQTKGGMNLSGNALRTAGKVFQGADATLAPIALGQDLITANNQGGSQNPQEQQQYPHPGSLPQTMPNSNTTGQTGLTSSQGRYSMVSPFDEGLATPIESLKSQIQALQARLPDEQLNNPQAAAADSGMLAKLQTDLSTQAPLSNKWTQTNTIMGVANAASDMLSKAPPQFWQQFKTLEQLRSANDPQYARLINALDYLDKNVPGSNLFTAKNLEGALGSLDQVVQNAQTEYQGVKSQFVGGNTLNPVGSQSMSLPPMAQVQTPPTGQIGQPVHYGFNFGQAGQNLPPIQ